MFYVICEKWFNAQPFELAPNNFRGIFGTVIPQAIHIYPHLYEVLFKELSAVKKSLFLTAILFIHNT